MTGVGCRACRRSTGEVVLDLGEQPPADYFPPSESPGPDPVYPLQMWLCAACGLAQLLGDPTVPEETRAVEPAALGVQSAAAIGKVAEAGMLAAGATAAEFESPHGGSWMSRLVERGLVPVAADGPADVVIDSFGMMHAADQAAALARRAARVGPGGVLLLQYHSLETIVRRGQWNALRHGHFAYYSTTALAAMLATVGFVPCRAWEFELYGGTVLLAATRGSEARPVDESVAALLAREARSGVCDPAALNDLERAMVVHAEHLHDWLVARRDAGENVLGYAAASRAVSLLVRGRIDASLLPVVVDASPAKDGRRMPGTGIPIVGPSYLEREQPDQVLLFVPDLLAEVRARFPDVEARGGKWVDVETIGR